MIFFDFDFDFNENGRKKPKLIETNEQTNNGKMVKKNQTIPKNG